MNYTLFFSLLFSLYIGSTQAQQEFRHHVYFEEGEAVISLEQLEEIKQFSANAQNLVQAKVVVRIYTNDAQGNESNYKLSGHRAALMKQCLQREGIQEGSIQIEHMGTALAATQQQQDFRRAELILTSDQHLFQRKSYQQAIFSAVQEWFKPHYDIFDIKPQKDTVLITSKGVVLYIPMATFDSNLVDTTVQLLVNSSHNPMEILTQYMSTLSGEHFLNSSGLLHLQAFWKGQKILKPLNKEIAILFPSRHYQDNALVYQSNPVLLSTTNWEASNNTPLPCAGFYSTKGYFCDPQFLIEPRLPYFASPPAKPIFTNIDSIIAIYDERIKTFDEQLTELEKDILNVPNEKKNSLVPKLRQKHKAIEWAQKTIAIKKDNLKEAYNREVEEKEAVYYQKLAAYNKNRNKQQQSYIRLLNNWANSKDSVQLLCKQEKETIQKTNAQYGVKLINTIRQQVAEKGLQNTLGFWISTKELGWKNIAHKLTPSNTTKYQINTKESAYGISAFLVFKNSQTVIMGQAETGRSISFGRLPYEQNASLVVIRRDEKGLSWGFYDINTNIIPPFIEFDYYSQTEVFAKLLTLSI